MNFQILDADYTYSSDRPVVRLYGRDESGNSICCLVPGFEPYFYVKAGPESKETLKKEFREHIKDIEVVSRFEPIGYFKNPIPMLKIILYDPKGVPVIRDDVREMVDEIYESDILFRNRYLIDNGLGGMGWARAEPVQDSIETHVTSDIRITARKVEPLDILLNAPLRHLAFDIECLPLNGAMPVPDTSPIILISLAFAPDFKDKKTLVLVGKHTDMDGNIESCGSEEAMLRRFFEIIREYDPDILVGYNSNSFDIPYIVDRIKALNKKGARIDPVMGRDGKPVYYRKMGNVTRISAVGRVVADALPLVRRGFSLKQYTLKNAAKELLGVEKLDIPFLEMETYWRDDGEKLTKFIEYARRDAELALGFVLKLRLIDKYIALARTSGTLLQDILDGGQTQMVENLLLREYRRHERVMPAKPSEETSDERFDEGEELAGGEVLEPKKGLLENIVILDYKSLYPTIMMAHNLCYTTVVVKDRPDDVIKTPSGGVFASHKIVKGTVPSILEELLDRRQATREKMKTADDEEYRVLDATQLALKILLNSFYGYSGYARARLYSLTLASAVTSFGRQNILRTKTLIEDEIKEIILKDGEAFTKDEAKEGRIIGLSVVYGDTDSVFVNLIGEGITHNDAELIGRKIAKTVTSSLEKPMELVFDSFARRAIFIAKKRYAVLLWEKSPEGIKQKIKVKGMETVRRDWCELTTKTVERVLELVLKEGKVDDAIELVENTIDSIREVDARKNPELFDELILTRQYTKKVENYKSRQPHITVVEKLKSRGIVPNVGDRIPFIILAGNGLFVERAEDPEYAREKNLPLDVDYYVNKQILPPVERILADLGEHGEKLRMMREKKTQKGQRSLFDF
ncbi:DNA polymerase elongation subunit (family B) [Candidatus Methanoperedens nitroreducens]|uniref:DNA polymerase n=1 Tax=Candidatus Methanoperedens nitratireducens TaxID=1392998 RepID=A0A062UYV7_9EURY|nr:DNA-directed DNA polymerase [Candidatus Methanoperedens nitroreducens]KCZ72116.1 DNA polymerase elongation subunit (family B) [Candidatus Methanoperedens nitroreducens]MDJ1421907.1 DNA-directed DNA polymerase [Candidatus Methanoperedens sp.]